MVENIIEVGHLSCTSGNRYLLQNINWQIKRGEHWVLFGTNGCGKTTLLSIIAGFKSYDHGTVRVFGEAYTPDNILALRKKIGWISSSFFDKCYDTERAIDIVLSGLSGKLGKGFDIANRDLVRARALMAQMHLADKIERPFHLMSKGERQNVLIARALIGQPEILVLDEPGTGLDVFARDKLLALVDGLSKQKDMTIIYVTHYPEEILPMFDQCLLMKDGAVYQQGKTAELFRDEYISEMIGQAVHVMQKDGRYMLQI